MPLVPCRVKKCPFTLSGINVPPCISHKWPIPISQLFFNLILHMCTKFPHGEHWCASWCWCSPTRHATTAPCGWPSPLSSADAEPAHKCTETTFSAVNSSSVSKHTCSNCKSSKICSSPSTLPFMHATLGQKWWPGVSSNIQFVSIVTPTSVFQDREHYIVHSHHVYKAMHVVLLHWRRATGSIWGWQDSELKEHDCSPPTTRNIQYVGS